MKKEKSELELIQDSEKARVRLEHFEKLKQVERPVLLTRYFAAFFDFIFTAILFVIMLTCFAYPYLSSTNYGQYVDQANTYLISTRLYLDDEGVIKTKQYDKDEIDQSIIYFYSTDSRAIQDNKLQSYNQIKLETNIFVLDGSDIVLNSSYKEEELKSFLQNQYIQAIEYAKEDAGYIDNLNKAFVIFFFMIILFVIPCVTIIYLLIPLINKNRATPAHLIFRLAVKDSRDLTMAKKWQVACRYLIILSFDYILIASIYLKFGSFLILLPIMISLFFIGFTKLNLGPHCMITNTIVTKAK